MAPAWWRCCTPAAVWMLLIVVVAVQQRVVAGNPHVDNWAVLVGTSRYWFNYRHASNPLAMYHHVKRLGIPDSHIILMLADDMACNARNPFPGHIFLDDDHSVSLYGTSVDVDFKGEEVTIDNMLRLLTDRLPADVAPSKRLASHQGSNVLVYMTGHGGDGFLKFQDASELTAQDLADAVEEMASKQRFREMLFVFDTCEAESMGQALRTQGVAVVASSRVGQNSYGYGLDTTLGMTVADGFTLFASQFLGRSRLAPGVNMSRPSLADLLTAVPYHQIRSHAVARTDLIGRPPSQVALSDFFTAVSDVVVY